tara:strand:+ start:805 stop:1104 length:300 start_codon:yes stop_codon:yes gene_type:complete
MRLNKFLKTRKLLLLNIILAFYVTINLIGGERGLISYFEKNKLYKHYSEQKKVIDEKINYLEKRNDLLSTNLDLDYIDFLYRQKLKFGKVNEKIIKINN